jgi:hypothetical protein
VALSWIQKSSNSLKPFVANRVQTIQCLSTPSSWRFVPGKENPGGLRVHERFRLESRYVGENSGLLNLALQKVFP